MTVRGTPKSLWESVNRHFGEGKGYVALRKKQVPFSKVIANEAHERVFLLTLAHRHSKKQTNTQGKDEKNLKKFI